MDVKYKTAESIIRKDRKTLYISRHEIEPRQRGGARNFKVSQRMRDELSNNVNDHPEYTLIQMNQELQRKLTQEVRISDSTIAHVIESMGITTKT